MKTRKEKSIMLSVRGLPEYTIKDLLNVDFDLLYYRIRARIKRLKRKEKELEGRINELSRETERPYGENYIEELKKDLSNVRRELEMYERILSKICIVKTLCTIEKEIKDRNRELWSGIEEIRLKDLLGFEGDCSDKVAVYNYLISTIKGLPVVGLEQLSAKPITTSINVEEQKLPRSVELNIINVSEKDYIDMDVKDWIELLNKCFKEGKQLELPGKYLAEDLRRPLRNIIIAMLEIPPEKLKRIIPSKYKYLLISHSILYTILRDGREYVVTPGSSSMGYIEGEGGVLNILQADVEKEESSESIRKRIYRVKIGEQERRIVKEVILRGGKAVQIVYKPG